LTKTGFHASNRGDHFFLNLNSGSEKISMRGAHERETIDHEELIKKLTQDARPLNLAKGRGQVYNQNRKKIWQKPCRPPPCHKITAYFPPVLLLNLALLHMYFILAIHSSTIASNFLLRRRAAATVPC
jgi:hypothetical protein